MGERQAYALAAKYNARLLSEGKTFMRWTVESGGALKLVPVAKEDRPTPPARDEEDRLL